jgi:hypothetical protein
LCDSLLEALEKQLSTTFTLSFNRSRGRYSLFFNGTEYEQTVCEFLQTISYLVGKDVEEYLLNVDAQFDTVRIPLTGSGKIIILDLVDFISFREVYAQEMFLLKLEDLLMRQGIQSPKHVF